MPNIRTSSSGRGKVVFNGPLFDEARLRGVLHEACRKGTADLLPQVVDVVKRKLDTSLLPPEETGRYKASIVYRVYSNGSGTVKSTETRRIKNWIETRVREGKKLGKGAYPFRAGKTYVKKVRKQGFYEKYLIEALNK